MGDVIDSIFANVVRSSRSGERRRKPELPADLFEGATFRPARGRRPRMGPREAREAILAYCLAGIAEGAVLRPGYVARDLGIGFEPAIRIIEELAAGGLIGLEERGGGRLHRRRFIVAADPAMRGPESARRPKSARRPVPARRPRAVMTPHEHMVAAHFAAERRIRTCLSSSRIDREPT